MIRKGLEGRRRGWRRRYCAVRGRGGNFFGEQLGGPTTEQRSIEG